MTDYCTTAPGHPLHGPYHDSEYGFPARADDVLFERMILEINQAGLSWELMLRKRPAFRAAFEGYDLDRIAAYGEADRARLLADASIIRNRRKIDAVIRNAQTARALRDDYGSLAGWLDAQHPLPLAEWVKLMRKTFAFMGPEVVREFLMSLGYLPGAHRENCPAHHAIATLDPPWMWVRRANVPPS